MCGIVGMVAPNPSEELLWRMTDTLTHRGPDDSGIFVNGNIGLGSRRLSIIDLSSSGHQPMANEDETVWIVHNGEVYNYIELREELGEYKFKSSTDTEVVLHAYEKWGESCVEQFNGMFAFAIWDSRTGKLFCVRDRLGIKPFYYYQDDDRFLFASEIKALLVAGIPRQPNDSVIYDYLAYGYYDHSDNTFFDRVKQIPPGHYMVIQNENTNLRKYWDVAESISPLNGLTGAEYTEKFNELLRDSVRLRLRSDVPLGVNLSGGLDSPSLVYTVNNLLGSKGDLKTFSMCYDDKKYDERELIEKLVPLLNCRSNFSYFEADDVSDVVEKVLWHQEQPFGGIPTMAYWKLMGLARNEEVTVLLEGQGVDEMLAGYRYFYGALFLDYLTSLNIRQLYREIKGYKRLNNLSFRQTLKFITDGVLAYSGYGSQDASRFLKPNCLAPEFKAKYNRLPKWPSPFKSRLSNMMYRDIRYTKLPRVLRFNDRMSMAFSRELRVPYLDHRIVEFAFSIPTSQKIKEGVNKVVLRNAMEGSLPEELRNRPKLAVASPQQDWFRTSLKDWLCDIIESESFAGRGYFNVSEVKREFEEYCRSDRGQNSFFIWQWVNLELWFRMFIDNDYPSGGGKEDSIK